MGPKARGACDHLTTPEVACWGKWTRPEHIEALTLILTLTLGIFLKCMVMTRVWRALDGERKGVHGVYTRSHQLSMFNGFGEHFITSSRIREECFRTDEASSELLEHVASWGKESSER